VILEGSGLEFVRSGLRSDETVAPRIVECRAAEGIRAALGYHVDAGPDEIALPDIVRRDVDLHLLEGVQRDRGDTGTIARLATQAERIVEVRPIDRHVVQLVFLTGEG